MSKFVYVVMGQTGEYSDRSEWPVKGFWSSTVAEDYAFKATVRAAEIQKTRPSRYVASKEADEYDPDMRMDYTGTDYFVLNVPMAEEV